MPGSHQQQQLPAWLRAVREAGPSPWGQCTEVTRKERSCTIEDTSDGRRYRQCTEVLRRFRVCAGRCVNVESSPSHKARSARGRARFAATREPARSPSCRVASAPRREPEEVATSVIETHEPLVDLDVASAEHSQRGASVVPSDAGQLLEEFFAFAGELKQELLRSGAGRPWCREKAPGEHHAREHWPVGSVIHSLHQPAAGAVAWWVDWRSCRRLRVAPCRRAPGALLLAQQQRAKQQWAADSGACIIRRRRRRSRRATWAALRLALRCFS